MTPQPAKPRVLIVDDNAANRYAFEAVLESEYTVVLAESGKQALDLALKTEFAVILLDVRMPEMDGFDTAEALRAREGTVGTPIIFTSAYDKTLDQMTRGYVAGATDFLFSPVEASLLKLKVATYAKIYMRQEALRLQVRELNEALSTLHAELTKRGLAVTRLKAQLAHLEATASDIGLKVSSA
jgi:CheY-like chemotaxis protein